MITDLKPLLDEARKLTERASKLTKNLGIKEIKEEETRPIAFSDPSIDIPSVFSARVHSAGRELNLLDIPSRR